MNQPYQLILDVWEGQLECNEAEFKAGGVAGLIIRLNDTLGGHHRDTGFDKQWAEAGAFIRWPYFVYNPWVDGKANFDWLYANMPKDCSAVAIDVEVVYPNYSPVTYAAELRKLINLARAYWKVHIYTGAGFTSIVSPWPSDVDYWWSQYPYSMYPDQRINVSWSQLAGMIAALPNQPMNTNSIPGKWRLWQCSGDRLIVPGTTRAMDINVFPGTLDELKTWLGYSNEPLPPVPPAPPVTTYPQYRAISGHNPWVHVSPSSESPTMGYLLAGEVVEIDTIDTTSNYMHIPSRGWVFSPFMELVTPATTPQYKNTCPKCGYQWN